MAQAMYLIACPFPKKRQKLFTTDVISFPTLLLWNVDKVVRVSLENLGTSVATTTYMFWGLSMSFSK
jgi:hypothetical protein